MGNGDRVCKSDRREEERENGRSEEENVDRASSAEAPIWQRRTEEDRERDIIKYKRNLDRKNILLKMLKERVAELRALCINEGELTGVLPIEIEETLRPGEELPKLKKRVGTTFQLSEDMLPSCRADKVQQLESEVELQKKIVAANSRLAKDKSTNKSVRKKRTKDLTQAQSKLRCLENDLHQMRLSASKPDLSTRPEQGDGARWSTSSMRSAGVVSSKSCPTTPRGSMPDLAASAMTDGEDDDVFDGNTRPASCSLGNPEVVTSSMVGMPSNASFSSSAAPSGTSSSSLTSTSSLGLGRANRGRPRHPVCTPLDELDDPMRANGHPLPPPSVFSTFSYESVGYRSCASYKSTYRTAHYPTLQEQGNRSRAHSHHDLDAPNYGASRPPTTGWEPQLGDEPVMPIRTMSTSQSCMEGFACASVDRRTPREPPSPIGSVAGREVREHGLSVTRDSPARDSSPSTQRITTFPVTANSLFYKNRLGVGHSSVPRLGGPFHLQGPPPSLALSRLPPSTQSTGKLPTQPDPRMEALLESYREKQRSAVKTATIV